ncbi:hypothetical protein ACFQU7_00310 [Pseudoroseomonas wenyumeiae]
MVEGPRGEVLHWLALDEAGLIRAAFARDPGWMHVPLLEAAVPGTTLGDLPLVRASSTPPPAGWTCDPAIRRLNPMLWPRLARIMLRPPAADAVPPPHPETVAALAARGSRRPGPARPQPGRPAAGQRRLWRLHAGSARPGRARL